MKKVVKYILWLPFAVSISSFALYFVYAIRIKFKNLTVTESMQNSLKLYLIIGLISLFVGLFVVFIKKTILLFKMDDSENIREDKVKENKIKEQKVSNKVISIPKKEQKVSNKVISIPKKEQEKTISKNELILKILNPVFKDNKITGTLDTTNQDVIVYLDKEEEKVEIKQEVIKENEIVDDLLIDSNCPECGYPISKDAAICPHCGILFDEKVLGIIKSNEKKLKKKNKKFSLKKFILDMFLILLFMILIFLVGNMLINKSAENYNNVNGTNVVSEK